MRRLVPVVVLVTLLAGCTSAPTVPSAAPNEPVVETPAPAPTPEPTQEPETGLVQPAQVFDGDCNAIFPIDELKAILGSSVKRTDSPDSSGEASRYVTAQSGGVTCSWASADYANGIVVTAVPAAALPLTTAKACQKDGYGGGGVDCSIEAEANATRLSGKVWFAKAGSRNATKTATLVSLFEEKAAAAQAVPLPIPNEKSWANPVDCSILEPMLDNPKVLGGTGDLQIYQGNGSDVYVTPAERVLFGFDDRADQVACAITTADPNRELTKAEIKAGKFANISMSFVGGAAWVEKELATWDGVEKLTIEGVDSAYLVTHGDESGSVSIIVAFDGPNMLSATTTAGGVAKRFATITLAVEALNAS